MREWIDLFESWSHETINTLDDMIAAKADFISDTGTDVDWQGIADTIGEMDEQLALSVFFDHVAARLGDMDRVYRCISVRNPKAFIAGIQKGRSLGNHWTFDRNSASSEYHSEVNHEHEILLIAKVDSQFVEWSTTFQQNFSHVNEQEVFIEGRVHDLQIMDRDGAIIFQGEGPFRA